MLNDQKPNNREMETPFRKVFVQWVAVWGFFALLLGGPIAAQTGSLLTGAAVGAIFGVVAFVLCAAAGAP